MHQKILVAGKYIGDDPKGTIIGGKIFSPGRITRAEVGEAVFTKLVAGSIGEDPWFEFVSHNYHVFGGIKASVPAGGTTGQILVKSSDDDYDVAWVDPTETTVT